MNRIKEIILDQKNKKMGLIIILVSLAMLFSVILLPFGFNPLYLFETFLIVPFIGNALNIAI